MLLLEIPYLPGIYTILGILALGVLILTILDRENYRWLISVLGELILLVTLAYVIDLPAYNESYIAFDEFSRFMTFVFIISSMLIIMALHHELRDVPRYGLAVSLILAANIGMIMAAASLNLVYIVVGWELAGVSSYAVVAVRRRDPLAIEAAMKFFIVGSIGFGLSLFGISFIFGAVGTFSLPDIAGKLANSKYEYNLLYTGLVLLISGLGFKMAIVPFHVWIPDTYDGAPNSIASFLAAASKSMAFAVGLRIFYHGLYPVSDIWSPLFAVLAIITMTYANLAALAQTKMKRLLAWSSIAHAGYIILLFGAYGLSQRLIAGGLFHIFMHAIMKILAFVAAAYITVVIGSDLLNDYAGIGRTQKIVSFFLTIDLLAMAGIPPLGGFWSKYLLFLGVVETGYVWLALIAVINSAISLYYYARIIKLMYFDVGKGSEATVAGPRIYLVPVILSGLLIMAVGIYPDPLINYLLKISP